MWQLECCAAFTVWWLLPGPKVHVHCDLLLHSRVGVLLRACNNHQAASRHFYFVAHQHWPVPDLHGTGACCTVSMYDGVVQ